MAVSTEFRDFVLEQLAGLEGLESRRMFGGFGLYAGGIFFALIARPDTLYLRIDESTVSEYDARGMRGFQPFPERPQPASTRYREVPPDVLEDRDECLAWARRALAVAAAARTAPKAPRRKGAAASRAKRSARGRRRRGA